MKKIQALFILWILLQAPIGLFTIGWGLKLIFREAGLVIFGICCISMFTIALGLLWRLDILEARHHPRPDGQ